MQLYRDSNHEMADPLSVAAWEHFKSVMMVLVEPCKHGNYARHVDEDQDISEGGSMVYLSYCDGAAPKGDS